MLVPLIPFTELQATSSKPIKPEESDLIFVDRILVAAPTQSVRFGSAAVGGQGALQTPLHGDNDWKYILFGRWNKPAVQHFMTLRPEGNTADQEVERRGGGGAGSNQYTDLRMAFSDNTIDYHRFTATLDSRRGLGSRGFTCNAGGWATGGSPGLTENYGGGWDNDVLLITFLDIFGDAANTILANSEFILYKTRVRA